LRRNVSTRSHGLPGNVLVQAIVNAALRLAPTMPVALINRAIMLVRERRPKEALADLDMVLKFEPTSGIALYYRARVNHELGHVKEFEQDVRASCKAGFGPACAALRR